MAGSTTADGGLLERGEQLEQVCSAIDVLRSGSGGVSVISGPAGIGKTTLLAAAVDHARRRGVAVLAARGEELERDLGHGVTRQLLDRALAERGDAEVVALFSGAAALAAPVLGVELPAAVSARWPATDPEFAVRHGLTWLLAGLAGRGPLLMALDDAHWADPPALRWIAYLAQRLDHVPVLVMLARRTAEPCGEQAALDAICAAGDELSLGPLSAAAVGELVRSFTGLTADETLVAQCMAASGGNPFLLDATLAALREEGTAALRSPLAAARIIAPTILRRLSRLPTDAAAVARAVAVLSDGAPLEVVARFAGLPIDRAAAAADTLVLADLFAAGEVLGFTHALVRDAIAADVGQHATRAAHGRAAEVLRSFGAPVERIASHLLLAPPARDPAATADLRAAARRSLARGAPTTAVTLLERALVEPPAPAERGAVLLDLGMAELLSGAPSAADRLGEAIEEVDDAAARAAGAHAQVIAFMGQSRVDDAAATIERIRPMLADDPGAILTIDALRLTLPITYMSHAPQRERAAARLRRDLATADRTAAATRGATLVMAAADSCSGTPSPEVHAAVHEAWGDGALLDALGPGHVCCLYATVALAIAGDQRALEVTATQIADRATAVGSVVGACHAWTMRATARELMGKLADAEADADLTLRSSTSAALSLARDTVRATLARIAIERGDLKLARTWLEGIDNTSDAVPTILNRLGATARLAQADGDSAGERDALRRLQRMSDDIGFATWSVCPWPADLAIALGPCDEARELADRALADASARCVVSHVGLALRAQAFVGRDSPDVERLRAAAAMLERSDRVLEHARTLVDLGATLRRRGQRREARKPLSLGLERAFRCGATALVDRARIELRATGARPRRLVVSGRDALTPSERRIASLAAEGRSNRDIAQTLFVTARTVETHLSHVYRKLDITSRTEIADALQYPQPEAGRDSDSVDGYRAT